MSLRLPGQPGVRLEAVATAYPGDLDDPTCVQLDNAAALRALLGADLEAVLAQRGWSADEPERAWGVTTRGWTRGRAVGALELALGAAREALAQAGRASGEVDAIVAATSTPTRVSASLSARVAVALGTDAACFDVRAGGAGGLNALLMASGLIGQGARRVLVVAVEVPSRFLDARDLANALLFGDGACALLLHADPGAEQGLLGAASGNVPALGRAFTIAGELDDLPPRPLLFQRPDAAYRAELVSVWDTALAGAAGLGQAGWLERAAVHPYAVTAQQVSRLEARLDRKLPGARATLARRGALGCVGSLAVFADAPRAAGSEHLLCAVGGGISWTLLRWRV